MANFGGDVIDKLLDSVMVSEHYIAVMHPRKKRIFGQKPYWTCYLLQDYAKDSRADPIFESYYEDEAAVLMRACERAWATEPASSAPVLGPI